MTLTDHLRSGRGHGNTELEGVGGAADEQEAANAKATGCTLVVIS